MVNGLRPWGNLKLLPLGPLREPLVALRRVDVAVVHHADLVLERNLKDIELMIREFKESVPIFYTRMAPTHFFDVRNIKLKVPLKDVYNAIILCVSAIGSSDAFVLGMQKTGACYIDQLDFSDHHIFQVKDIEMIMNRLRELEYKFGVKPIVVLTEKDYDRDPEILKHLHPFRVLILCSQLQIVSHQGFNEESFKLLLKKLFGVQ